MPAQLERCEDTVLTQHGRSDETALVGDQRYVGAVFRHLGPGETAEPRIGL